MASPLQLFRHFRPTRSGIPLFLCPLLVNNSPVARVSQNYQSTDTTQKTNLHTESVTDVTAQPQQLLSLPKTCPGCGAYTQTVRSSEPGFFNLSRKAVKTFVAQRFNGAERPGLGEAEISERVMKNADQSLLDQLGFQEQQKISKASNEDHATAAYVKPNRTPTPVCDRCHHLEHHHAGVPVVHPTLQSVREMISESPYKYNHIYHILDAADFPLSLIPSLQQTLSLSPARSMNRRAKKTYFQRGRTAEMSYIITRSDLLAPKKEQVDRLMPYFVEVLRDALGASARNVRLGNVRCASSKRGWWTKTVKEDIYDRGGGNWMVGKVNVGKSNLFEHVYPKGRTQDVNFDSLRDRSRNSGQSEAVLDTAIPNCELDLARQNPKDLSEQLVGNLVFHESALPPVPKETPFPILPLVSVVPGTTASPIRLSFGNGKGELIDLPGMDRGDLESFVLKDHKSDLVMRNRIRAKQLTIKTGQSLMIGGLVQITPTSPDMTVLAYPFVPLQCHVSSIEKAQAIITGEVKSGLTAIARPGMGHRMRVAGTFPLKWDVTKQRAGPLTAKAAVGLSTKTLPFIVLSTDILIEGCGWVELVAQVRKKDFLESEVAQTRDFFDDKVYPMVEVVSPDGRHVGYRRPVGAWLLGGEKPGAAGKRNTRPRRSMKGVKDGQRRIALAKTLRQR